MGEQIERRSPNRRGGQIWRYMRTFMRLVLRRPLVGVGVIGILPDGKIVLVRRVDSKRWGTPGGIMDYGETVEVTARREMKEETGLEITRVSRLVGVYSSPKRDPRVHAVSVVIAAEVRGEMQIRDTLELSDIRGFTLDEIPFGELAHDNEEQLRDFLSGATVVR